MSLTFSYVTTIMLSMRLLTRAEIFTKVSVFHCFHCFMDMQTVHLTYRLKLMWIRRWRLRH